MGELSVIFGSNLRRLRLKAGLTQGTLARLVWPNKKPKTGAVQIGNYERGLQFPQEETQLMLAGQLKCHVLEFYEDADFIALDELAEAYQKGDFQLEAIKAGLLEFDGSINKEAFKEKDFSQELIDLVYEMQEKSSGLWVYILQLELFIANRLGIPIENIDNEINRFRPELLARIPNYYGRMKEREKFKNRIEALENQVIQLSQKRAPKK